jgi:hypothetical protein
MMLFDDSVLEMPADMNRHAMLTYYHLARLGIVGGAPPVRQQAR